MGNRILNDLPKLIDNGIITNEVADSIRLYYQNDSVNKGGVLQIILAVLVAFLVGLGILLILAHNWDDMSVSVKTTLAFLPLVVAQGLVLYVILKKAEIKNQ